MPSGAFFFKNLISFLQHFDYFQRFVNTSNLIRSEGWNQQQQYDATSAGFGVAASTSNFADFAALLYDQEIEI